MRPNSHFYARIEKRGTFYGVWGTIETANPALREPLFSYVSLNIISPDGKWIETGWTKASNHGCVPKFTWATDPGTPYFIESPRPTVGIAYQYSITKVSDGNWKLQIMQTNGTVIVDSDIPNPGMNSGNAIQALGEVDSLAKINDMGVSGLLSLKWRNQSGVWSLWNGWDSDTQDSPYGLMPITLDPDNNIQVFGNNGTPIPPQSPCP